MQLFSNNADSSLYGSIADNTTVFTVKTGDGAKFPSPSGGDFFLLTLFQRVGTTEINHEIVKCTGRAGDSLTVVRAQEGTVAKAFNSGDLIELRVTAGTLENKVEKVSGKSLSTEDFTTARKTKLEGIAPGATANSTDAQLRDRATHTGTQAIETVSGLQTALDSKQPIDDDLTAIAALTGTSGLLKKTAADTWLLDTNTYLTDAPSNGKQYARKDAAWSEVVTNVGDVTQTGTQTLTNKTIHGNVNTLTVDGTNEVGFRHIPQNSQSATYTLVLADAGKHILHPAADTTARTFTIPANSAVAFPIGTAITFINQNGTSGVVTIAITSDIMRLAGAGTTGSRTLARNGIATAIKLAATEWIISGTGLT